MVVVDMIVFVVVFTVAVVVVFVINTSLACIWNRMGR